MRVKDLMKQLEELDPETELTIEPVQSFVIRPVPKEEE
tara:strand:- start:474 stop:587 length:114 start_codon:yes stop_codon:yes gene_type:complete